MTARGFLDSGYDFRIIRQAGSAGIHAEIGCKAFYFKIIIR